MPRLIAAVAVLAFTVYCLVDVIKTQGDQVKGIPKALWLVVVLLVPIAGGLAWLLAGRERPLFGDRTLGRDPRGGRGQGPLGPDDDPDFLRGL